MKWQLAAVASTHLCLAVEITGPNDPFVAPSLLGNTPGWPTTDLRVINDNNKAQRNMGLSTTPARGVGASDCYFAIVRNAATFPRDVELHYDASEATVKAFKGAAIEVPGGRDVAFKEAGVVRLPNMQPGENRWIGLRFPAAAGRAGQVFAVNFHEVVEGVPINGFAIGARIAAMDKVIREKLERHRSELTRLAGSGVEQAAESAKLAAKLAGSEKITPAAYLEFVTEQQGALKAGIKSLADAAKHFKLTAAMTSLTRAIASKDVAAVAVSHDCVINRIDSALTMQQIAEGDVANILHNVRWQQASVPDAAAAERHRVRAEARGDERELRAGIRNEGGREPRLPEARALAAQVPLRDGRATQGQGAPAAGRRARAEPPWRSREAAEGASGLPSAAGRVEPGLSPPRATVS